MKHKMLEEEYSHLKLWSMCNISWELDPFYIFFNFISFTEKIWLFYNEKNMLNTVSASDSIQQERLPVSLGVGRVYF